MYLLMAKAQDASVAPSLRMFQVHAFKKENRN